MKKYLIFALLSLSIIIVAQPNAGYYNSAIGKSEATLKTQLYNIISSNTTDVGYGGLYNVYRTSDNTSDGKVWDMYSTCTWTHGSKLCGNYYAVCDCYNREHSIPQSWFGEQSPMVSDAFHVYPTDGKVNGQRSSFPFGECSAGVTLPGGKGRLGSSTFAGYSGTVFEPDDEFKGDFARTYFYFSTRYQNIMTSIDGESFNRTTYPSLTEWSINLFLKWHRQDPVSIKETVRNNAIEVFQKNRNPFIDYPELAEHIWGTKKDQAWSGTSINYPTLISPSSSTTIDFGSISYLNSIEKSVQVKASNLTGDLTFAISGANAANFTISTNSITKTSAETGYSLNITYKAQTIGAESAYLIISGGGLVNTMVNLKAFSSDNFMALSASEISNTSFKANWTSSLNATDYLLNVYSFQKSEGNLPVTILEEDFNAGLPSSWTSSGYINGTEVAGSIRLASSSSVGIISTPAVNLSTPTTLIVKAKQYVNDAMGRIVIKVNNDSIAGFLTNSINQNYTVNIPTKNASSNISLSATGGSGKRVYVDYVKVETVGATITKVMLPGFPKLVGNVLTHKVEGLAADSNYYYTVQPEGNSSTLSNEVLVHTILYNDFKNNQNNSLLWSVLQDGVLLQKIPENCLLTLMDLIGNKIKIFQSTSTETKLKLSKRGIYLLVLQHNSSINTIKIVF